MDIGDGVSEGLSCTWEFLVDGVDIPVGSGDESDL